MTSSTGQVDRFTISPEKRARNPIELECRLSTLVVEVFKAMEVFRRKVVEINYRSQDFSRRKFAEVFTCLLPLTATIPIFERSAKARRRAAADTHLHTHADGFLLRRDVGLSTAARIKGGESAVIEVSDGIDTVTRSPVTLLQCSYWTVTLCYRNR